MLLLLACLVIQAIGATAIATATPAKHAHATQHGPPRLAAHILPPALKATATRSRRADRQLVARAKGVKRCLRANRHHPNRCKSARRALQRAGVRLARIELRLARLARAGGRTANFHGARASRYGRRNARRAPVLTVTGQNLSWNRVAYVNTYVLVIKVPRQADEYSVVSGVSLTPPPVPGVTVKYSVRTTAEGSAWATEKSITYPAAAPAPEAPEVKTPETPKPEEKGKAPEEKAKTPEHPKAPEEVRAPEKVDTQAAPELKVSGQKLVWNPLAGVSTYVFVTKVPGRTDVYSAVSGVSFTPPVVPGATVNYSVRTAVEGSAWAPEVSITYPAATVPTPPVGPPAGPITTGGFEMGLNSGSAEIFELPSIQALGAHTARLEFPINASVSQLAPVMEAYAKAGIRPLLLATFDGTMPSVAEAQNLGTWAAAFGPGGTFWQGKNLPASAAPTEIEFGNENNDAYQYAETASASNWYNLPGYATRARDYALRFQSAALAIQAVNHGVGLIAQGGDGGCGCTVWVNNMFSAVPNLGSLVAGWTIHPYGPGWQSTIDRLISQTAAVGAPSSIPIDVTEWGLATDNGRCLSDNYGFNRCMTYSEAATTLSSSLAGIRARYGTRFHTFYLYQARDQKPSGASGEREAYFGALQSSQGGKGNYTTTVQSLLAANP